MRKKSNNLSATKNLWLGLTSVIVLAGVAVGYIYWQSSSNETTEVDQHDHSKMTDHEHMMHEQADRDNSQPAVFVPTTEFVDNTTAVLNTLNTEPLLAYMQDRVEIYYNSTTPDVSLDAVSAANTLLYFSDATTPWNLKLSQNEIDHYKNTPGFEKLFGPGCLSGHSADANHIVSFCFTADGKIHSIFLGREPEIFN